jgi:hypothetical protein
LTAIPRAYALPSAKADHHGDVTGTISIDLFDAFILFDSGTSCSFISNDFMGHIGISVQYIGQSIIVNFDKRTISSNFVCPGCVVRVVDKRILWLIL